MKSKKEIENEYSNKLKNIVTKSIFNFKSQLSPISIMKTKKSCKYNGNPIKVYQMLTARVLAMNIHVVDKKIVAKSSC